MKKFVSKSLFFVLFFTLFSILINSLFLGIIALTDWDFVKRLESLKFEKPDFDLLVIGSSLAEYGIDTELLTSQGVKSFNLSLVGSDVKTNYIQLNEYLTKYPTRPKYVILALNSILERLDNDGIQPVVEFTMKNHSFGINDVPISKFNWAGMELLKKALIKQYRKTTVSCGHKKSLKVVPDNTNVNELYFNSKNIESAHWIGEIAKLCNQNGIELLILEMPGVREVQNLSEIGPYIINFKNGYSASLFNFNSKVFCEVIDVNKDWCGMSHLNKYGSAKFTNEVYRIVGLTN